MFECTEIEWERLLPKLPAAHFLQSSNWAAIKAKIGWQPNYLVWKNDGGQVLAGACVLERSLKAGFLPLHISIQYVPKGPLLDWNDQQLAETVLHDLAEFAHKHGTIFIKIDPDVILENQMSPDSGLEYTKSAQEIVTMLSNLGWRFSDDQIQFQNTVWLNLDQEEETILEKMKQKTRYNIRLAEKKGVKVRVAALDEYPIIYKLYAETSIRDNFVIRSAEYYLDLWEKFSKLGICEILIAEFEGEPIAGLVIYYFAEKAFYIYGMSSNQQRNLMPTYLIQWEAIKRARQNGKKIYDLWGAPGNIDESDPMWGVYRFKLGLGGSLVRMIGAWDFPASKLAYYLYQKVLPQILKIMRKVGRKKTQLSIE
jgi:lipid II:glycine glycyltransferase (peptidoglycan interpeptide bridge formation enzyme)